MIQLPTYVVLCSKLEVVDVNMRGNINRVFYAKKYRK